jgi:hypothetical protein
MSNTAISVIALSQSTVAMQQSQEAAIRSCKSYISSFHAETATTTQMQEYAHCVGLVYPQPLAGGEIWLLKAAIIVAFVGMGIGIYKSLNDSYNEFTDHFMFGLVGFFLLPALVAIILCIVYAAAWVVGIV